MSNNNKNNQGNVRNNNNQGNKPAGQQSSTDTTKESATEGTDEEKEFQEEKAETEADEAEEIDAHAGEADTSKGPPKTIDTPTARYDQAAQNKPPVGDKAKQKRDYIVLGASHSHVEKYKDDDGKTQVKRKQYLKGDTISLTGEEAAALKNAVKLKETKAAE